MNYVEQITDGIRGFFISVILSLTSCGSLNPQFATTARFHEFKITTITIDQAARLRKAEIDFRRIRSGLEPIHARCEQTLRDGGSKIYRGSGYYLRSNNTLEKRGGHFGHLVGPSISFGREITGSLPAYFEETHFVPLH
jgi:hypothetical protein